MRDSRYFFNLIYNELSPLGQCKVIKTEEFKLRQNWPVDYDVDARPVRDHSQPVRVRFGVAIGQITEVVGDYKHEFIYMSP